MNLLRFEWLRFRRSAEGLFERKLNFFIFTTGLVIVLAPVLASVAHPSSHGLPAWLADAAFPCAGAMTEWVAMRRLTNFEATFLVLPARARTERFAYRLLVHAPALFLTFVLIRLVGLANTIDVSRTASSIATWLVGGVSTVAFATFAGPWLERRARGFDAWGRSGDAGPTDRHTNSEALMPRRSLFDILVSAQRIWYPSRQLVWLAAACMGALAALVPMAASPPDLHGHNIESALLALLVVFPFAVAPARTVRFTALNGVELAATLTALASSSMIAVVSDAALTGALYGPTPALAALAGGALPIVLAAYRVLLYRREPRAPADRRMQREFLVLMLVVGTFPMIAPMTIAVRMVVAAIKDRRNMWNIG